MVARWFIALFAMAVSLWPSSMAPLGPIFTLEIPELRLTVPGDSSNLLPRADFNTFQIVIHAPQIKYGSIHSKINTESAGIIMDTRTVGDTVVCTFDLNRRAGFHFNPGRNSVEIEATDTRGHLHYSSFLLNTGRLPGVAHNSSPRPAPEDIRGAEKYAVIIGVSKYKDPAVPPLQYADRDAMALVEDQARRPEIYLELIDLTLLHEDLVVKALTEARSNC